LVVTCDVVGGMLGGLLLISVRERKKQQNFCT